jgi:hypothetical protein
MIPDEIIRRRIPLGYGYGIPHSEFTDQPDPSSVDPDGYFSQAENPPISENDSFNAKNSDTLQPAGGEDTQNKIASSKVFPGGYSRRIADDRSMIASDIRKYLSSGHVNPSAGSGFFERRRRMARFTSLL